MARDLTAQAEQDLEIGPLPGHPDMDYPEHERTYLGFVSLFKWGTIFCASCIVLLGFMTL